MELCQSVAVSAVYEKPSATVVAERRGYLLDDDDPASGSYYEDDALSWAGELLETDIDTGKMIFSRDWNGLEGTAKELLETVETWEKLDGGGTNAYRRKTAREIREAMEAKGL
jgi:hypothetical protein